MAESELRGQDLIADDVFVRLGKLDDELKKIIDRFSGIENAARGALSTNQLTNSTQDTAKAVDEANIAIKEQTRLEKQLAAQKIRAKNAQSDVNKELIRARVETQEIGRQQRAQARVTSQAAGAYRRLSAELLVAKNTLKDIIVEQGQFSRAARVQQQEVDKLSAKIRRADNAAGDFQRNVGNYPSALKGAIGSIRSLIASFGVLEGIRLGVRFIRDAQELAREAKGVEFAFERLGEEGEQALRDVRTQTRGLVSDLDIRRSLVNFDNFNISLQQSADLFEFLAVRSAQTGVSVDKLQDSLVEGLSKESKLRIDNLGISMADLNAELEKAPDFVSAVANIAKREIGEAGDVLDEAANGAERFSAAVENTTVEIGKLSNNFGIYATFSNLISFVGKQFEQVNRSIAAQRGFLDTLAVAIRTVTFSGQVQNEVLLQEIERRREVAKEIDAQNRAYVRLNGSLGPFLQGQGPQQQQFPFDVPENEEVARSLNEIDEEIKTLTADLQLVNNRADAKAIQDQIKILEDEKNAILGIVEAKKERRKEEELTIKILEEGSRAQLNATISELKKAQAETAIGSRAWREYGEAIKDTEEQLKNLENIFSGGIPDLIQIDEDELKIFNEVNDFLNADGIDAGLQQLAERLGVTQAELIEEFEALYDRDYKNFVEYQERKLEAERIIAEERQAITLRSLDVAQDFAQAFFDVQADRIEKEIELQNRAFDAIVNGKESSEEQIALAEKKREENEIRLQKEREKRQKRAFLVQQAIEVAKVVISAAQASAAALTLPPTGLGPVLGATLIPVIQANAALSIATILAQSIPAFFRGKEATDRYSGLATVNELPGQREVRVTKDGRIEMFKPGMQLTQVGSTDIIETSPQAFMKNLFDPRSETNRRVMGEVSRRGKFITQGVQSRNDQMFLKSIEESILKGYKKAKTNVNVTVLPPRTERRKFTS